MKTFPRSAAIAGAGRSHPTRPASVESTRSAGDHVTASEDRDTNTSAVLSVRAPHQTAYQSPVLLS
jgi:hypothetical protein